VAKKKVYGLAIVHIDDKSKYLLSDLINKLEQTERNKIKQLMESKPEQLGQDHKKMCPSSRLISIQALINPFRWRFLQ
jgi:organic hydroperoxide reductase OsmC/OhrA